MSIIINQKGGKAIVHVVNTTFAANLAAFEVTGEVLNSMDVSRLLWCGNTSVTRGTTIILQTNSGTAGTFDLQGNGISVTSNGTANVTVTTDGTAFVEFKKQATFTPDGM